VASETAAWSRTVALSQTNYPRRRGGAVASSPPEVEDRGMNLTSESVDVPAGDGRAIRCVVMKPKTTAPRSAVVLAYSDIFQLTGPHRRVCERLAGYGFVVVTPEIFGRVLPAGRGLDFERDRQLALDTTERLQPADFDADRHAVLAWMRAQSFVDPERLLACGWCIGGHLAFRAAQDAGIRATACFYATGLHSDTVGGAHGTAPTLAGAAKIAGPLLLVWGTRDPHIPKEGRSKIHRTLDDLGVPFHVRLYDAEHTFMRDEGARYEPVAADRAFADMLELFAPLRR
jgi:carboxymethylenebutenolidase